MNFNYCQTRKVKPPKPGSYKANRTAEIRKRVIIVCVLVAVIGSLTGGAYYLRVSNERNYAEALRFLQARNYTAAEEKFDHVHGYRDANTLNMYCKYAAMYRDRTTYKNGHNMLRFCHLQYDTEWQDDIDELSNRIEKYYKISQERPKTTYKKPSSSTKPSTTKPGISQSASKPSSSGKSSGTYNSRYGQTFNYGGKGGTHSTLRDDYDNPEDLYEDNKDWYEDEDEAWDEYYDDD